MSSGNKVRRFAVVSKYNKQVVDQLEELLGMARKGEIIELISVYRMDDGTYTHAWTGTDDVLGFVGILERTKQITLRRMDSPP